MTHRACFASTQRCRFVIPCIICGSDAQPVVFSVPHPWLVAANKQVSSTSWDDFHERSAIFFPNGFVVVDISAGILKKQTFLGGLRARWIVFLQTRNQLCNLVAGLVFVGGGTGRPEGCALAQAHSESRYCLTVGRQAGLVHWQCKPCMESVSRSPDQGASRYPACQQKR